MTKSHESSSDALAQASLVTQRFNACPVYETLGIEIVSLAAEEVRVALDITRAHTNFDGALHGGLVGMLADTAMGLVARMTFEDRTGNAALNLDVDYLAPARLGERVICVGRPSGSSRRFLWTACDVVRDGDGLLIARGKGLQMVRPPRSA